MIQLTKVSPVILPTFYQENDILRANWFIKRYTPLLFMNVDSY
jgi:hypothetical protein